MADKLTKNKSTSEKLKIVTKKERYSRCITKLLRCKHGVKKMQHIKYCTSRIIAHIQNEQKHQSRNDDERTTKRNNYHEASII